MITMAATTAVVDRTAGEVLADDGRQTRTTPGTIASRRTPGNIASRTTPGTIASRTTRGIRGSARTTTRDRAGARTAGNSLTSGTAILRTTTGAVAARPRIVVGTAETATRRRICGQRIGARTNGAPDDNKRTGVVGRTGSDHNEIRTQATTTAGAVTIGMMTSKPGDRTPGTRMPPILGLTGTAPEAVRTTRPDGELLQARRTKIGMASTSGPLSCWSKGTWTGAPGRRLRLRKTSTRRWVTKRRELAPSQRSKSCEWRAASQSWKGSVKSAQSLALSAASTRCAGQLSCSSL
mmetsp:Transcript_93935/g.223512  ORF Transcript_93935/g.223512 Transcript_93935/m.223512 type:complete len:294 (-) Transcript_93935:3013-3894(-)